MESAQNLLIIAGLGRLYRQITAAAMAPHGWDVFDIGTSQGVTGRATPRIALLFSFGAADKVIADICRLRAECPAVNVVLLTDTHVDCDVIRFIEAGISAWVTGDQSVEELVRALEMVRNHQSPPSGRVTQLALTAIRRMSRSGVLSPEARLTPREVEILILVSAGLSNKEIADRLSVAHTTVKNHVHHLLTKLKVRSRHEASWLQSRVPRGFPLAG